MSNLEKLLDLSDELDQNGLAKQAEIIDNYVDHLTKMARQGIHKCGLKEETVENHIELLKGYEKALSHYKGEYKKILQSNNEKDSPNYGKLREHAENMTYNCNAVNLHKMYMDDVINNNPFSLEKDSQMVDLLKDLYGGDYNKLAHELKRLALIPRNGWVLLSFCTISKELFFNVIDLHDQHVDGFAIPILALDMWEHAYYHDFGLDKEAYVDWFLGRIDWRNPRKRLKNLTRLK